MRELCYCKFMQSNPDANDIRCLDHCPLLRDLPKLLKSRRIEEKRRTPFLIQKDIRDIYNLAIKLKYKKDDLSDYIYSNILEVRNLLERYKIETDNAEELKILLDKKNPSKFVQFLINLRRKIILLFFGEWHPSSRECSVAISKNYSYPAAISERLAHDLCIVLNEKFLYENCAYETNKFPDLDKKLRSEDRILLNICSNTKKMPEKCVQLNRIILDSNYDKEITRCDSENYMWQILKKRLILNSKQAQYFDLASVQFFLLGLTSVTSIHSNKEEIIGIFMLMATIFVLLNMKEKEEPFGWFKNKSLRLLAVAFVWVFGYLYYILYINITCLG